MQVNLLLFISSIPKPKLDSKLPNLSGDRLPDYRERSIDQDLSCIFINFELWLKEDKKLICAAVI
jgi:hypothetical protein